MSINLYDLNLSREDKLSLLEQLNDDLKSSKNNLRSGQYLCVIGYDEIWKNFQKYSWLWDVFK